MIHCAQVVVLKNFETITQLWIPPTILKIGYLSIDIEKRNKNNNNW